ncbi:MAG TPA: hypothetical protein VHA11_13955 [Bryobacteraceae bacterium]|nr:hypothetical protein [Bryobacteraceae bacterium]
MIESLEHLQATGKALAHSAPRGRRGRKGMSADERQKVSERMKKYWASRRGAQNAAAAGSESSSSAA